MYRVDGTCEQKCEIDVQLLAGQDFDEQPGVGYANGGEKEIVAAEDALDRLVDVVYFWSHESASCDNVDKVQKINHGTKYHLLPLQNLIQLKQPSILIVIRIII